MVITEGLLWFDNSSRLSFHDKVQAGATAYERRYKRAATHCLVNPGDLPADEDPIPGLMVVAASTVLRHHFWIGVRSGRQAAR